MQLPTLEDLTICAPQITKEHNKQKSHFLNPPAVPRQLNCYYFQKKIPRKTLKCICPKGTFYAL